MPLSAPEIAERLWDGTKPISEDNTLSIVPVPDTKEILRKNAAAVDLRLGRWFRTMRHTRVTELKVGDKRSEASLTSEHYVRFNNEFVLHPGQFTLGITLEWLKLPYNLAGYVTGKSSWGRRGLIIETAAGIHPGFVGCLTLELANVGTAPIKLTPGMPVCQMFLHVVNKSERATSTQFVGYRKPGLGSVVKDETLTALSERFFD
jgi:dCTP deaminase